jgi:hypothetical protein
MQVAVIVAGAVAEIVGWWLVADRRFDVWKLMPVVLGSMGVAAVLVRAPAASDGASLPAALVVGLTSGLALYVGTRVFVWGATRWAPFRRDVLEKYGQAGEVTLATSLVLSLAIMVPAEEVFWRGLVQERLGAVTSAGAATLIAWLAYVGVNLASRSLPIVAGAIVGGALWAVLALWSGGVLASLASHILWTGLMLALPPGTGRQAIEGGAAR